MAQRAQVCAHRLDTTADRGRVLPVEDEKSDHESVAGMAVLGREQFLLGGDADQRLPRLEVARRDFEQQMVVDVDQAGAPLAAFEGKPPPQQRTRYAPQHFSPSTQVSLLPPPCDELTMSEPSRSATRVRPPASTRGFSPSSTKGRRSTWRAANAAWPPAAA